MCLGIPMQILEVGEFQSRCRGRHGEAWIDMRLIPPQPVGAWVLTFLDAAREALEPERAAAIDAALDALDSLAANGPGAFDAGQLDVFFADLSNREPQLPDFLRKDAE